MCTDALPLEGSPLVTQLTQVSQQSLEQCLENGLLTCDWARKEVPRWQTQGGGGAVNIIGILLSCLVFHSLGKYPPGVYDGLWQAGEAHGEQDACGSSWYVSLHVTGAVGVSVDRRERK